MQDQQYAPEKKQSLAIPVAIILAGIMVGSGIYFSGNDAKSTQGTMASAPATQSGVDIDLRPLSTKDHVLGTQNAAATLIEYSDFECPFCKTFHQTLQRLMGAYNDRIAWAYRHYPIAELHPKALKEAQATECAADQGKFWEYTNRLFEVTPSNNGLDTSMLPEIASDLDLDVATFNDCLNSTAHTADIAQSIRDAEAMGANGTPTSFLVLSSPLAERTAINIQVMAASFKLPDGTPLVTVSRDRKIVSLVGALPYDILKGIFDVVLDAI